MIIKNGIINDAVNKERPPDSKRRIRRFLCLG